MNSMKHNRDKDCAAGRLPRSVEWWSVAALALAAAAAAVAACILL